MAVHGFRGVALPAGLDLLTGKLALAHGSRGNYYYYYYYYYY